MLRSILLFLFSVLCAGTSTAQIPLSLHPWDHALTYNPASVGVFEDQYIQVSLMSEDRKEKVILTPVITFPPSPPSSAPTPQSSGLSNIFNRFAQNPSQNETQNIYYLGYQKTIRIGTQDRLTGALQLQRFVHNNLTLQNPTQVGFTTNYHRRQNLQNERRRYWSFGLQFNLILREPNLAVTNYIYEELLIPTPLLNQREYAAQFRNTGFQQVGSINYTYLKNKQTLFNIGLTVSSFQQKTVNRNASEFTGIHSFAIDTKVESRINLDYQRAFKNKFLIQFRFIVVPYEATIVAGGIGFKIGKHNTLKMMLALGGVNGISGARYTYLSIDTKRYKYGISFRKANSVTSLNYLQCSVQYRMNDRDNSSIISKDY